MAQGTWRSDSSASTNLTVNIYEINRNDNYVYLRCAWSVTLGGATNNSYETNRTLYLKNAANQVLSSAVIKNNISWVANNTYSGSWDFMIDVGTPSGGNVSITPSTSNEGTQSCIWTLYVSALSVDYSLAWTPASAATNLSCSPSVFENSVTFSWTQGIPGVNNVILDNALWIYHNNIKASQIILSPAGSTSYVYNTSSLARGTYVSFRIATDFTQSGTLQSAVSSSCRKNRVPNTPTGVTVAVQAYVPGDTIRLYFVNNGDSDNNAHRIITRRTIDNALTASTTNMSATYVDITTAGWAQGMQTAFQVALVDSFAIQSAWSTASATITLNAPPNPPVIYFPTAGSRVYNTRPFMLVQTGTSTDGPNHILRCANKNTQTNGSYFSCGTATNLAASKKIVMKPDALTKDITQTINATMWDGYLESTSVSRSFTVRSLSFTDATITPGVTKCKAAHIGELQNAINYLRQAYGFGSYSFTSCVAGTSLISNAAFITQLQTALQDVIDKINGWDTTSTTFDLTISWINISAAGGGVDAQKLRQAIEQLRTTILLI